MFQRMLPVFVALAHVALWAVAFLTLGRLQGQYPTHFDIQGQPDAWGEGGWFHFPLIALAVTGILVGSLFLGRRLAVTSPQWVNMPRKRDWVRLPLEGRLRSFKAAEGLIFGFAVFVNLMVVSVVLDTYGIATGAQTSVSMAKVVLVLVCLGVWLVLSILRIRQAVGDEVRAARQAGNQASGTTP